jgi:hypothetical protein
LLLSRMLFCCIKEISRQETKPAAELSFFSLSQNNINYLVDKLIDFYFLQNSAGSAGKFSIYFPYISQINADYSIQNVLRYNPLFAFLPGLRRSLLFCSSQQDRPYKTGQLNRLSLQPAACYV